MKVWPSFIRTPIAIKALVPVIPLAPNAFVRLTLTTRSRSIKNKDKEDPVLPWFIIRLFIKISLYRKPALLYKDSYPRIHPSKAPSKAAGELAL